MKEQVRKYLVAVCFVEVLFLEKRMRILSRSCLYIQFFSNVCICMEY